MENKELSLVPTENSITTINRGLPSAHEMMVFTTISKQADDSKMYKNYGGQAGIMMTMLAARELGISPMLALNGGIANIQGKLEISARMMNALMRRAGIKIVIKESTDDICTLIGGRNDSGDVATVSYTLADAQKAGLVKPGGGWVKNPKDMCFARAISRLARQIAPDIIGGCYVEGEIKASEAEMSLPSDIPYEVEDKVDEDKENLEKLMDLFEKDDKYLIQDYLTVVMTHFGWTKAQTVKEFLKDTKNLFDKFNTWKIKVKI